MPQARKPAPSEQKPSGDAPRRPTPLRKHPVLLALAVFAMLLWLGFLAYLAFRE